MNRNYIVFIIVIMTLTLGALIVVQFFWVQNAVELKEQQFRQQVNRALTQVAKRLELRETYVQVSEAIYWNIDTTLSIENQENNITVSSDSFNITLHIGNDLITTKKEHKNTTYYFAADSLVFDNYDGSNTRRSINEPRIQFDSTSEEDLKGKLSNKTILVQSVIEKLIESPRLIQDRINYELVSSVLEQEFGNRGLSLNYEFSVRKNMMDTSIVSSKGYEKNLKVRQYRTLLFPDDIFIQDNYLYVYFPTEKEGIVKSLGLMAYSSFILTFIIVLCFGFTIYIIFRQKHLSEIKNDFINNMTHELKTPISTVLLATQMLQDETIPNESKNIAHISGIIEDESKRLRYQVEKVLQMAVFEEGGMILSPEKMDINEILRTTTINFELHLKSRDGIMETDLAELPPIYIDKIHVSNVVANLIDNALKYCDKEPLIKVSSLVQKDYVAISVADNGIGMSKEARKRVFEKFYRVPTGNIHNVKGFGLGLSYVKKVMDEHHGLVKIQSEPSVGTTFTLLFPKTHKGGS